MTNAAQEYSACPSIADLAQSVANVSFPALTGHVGATHLLPRAEREPCRYSLVASEAGVLAAIGIILTEGARGMIRQSPLAKWELLGIPVVFLAGSALHFAFDWSGYWKPLAIIAAVNESVWEHLKLAFWPSLLWAVVGYAAFKPNAWAFWSAKGYALLVAPVLIVVIFYGYTSILGRNFLVFDITTFALAIAAGQLVSAQLMAAKSRDSRVCAIGVGLLLCQIAAYSTLTFHPPPLALFEDGRTGIRGIPSPDSRPAVPFHSVRTLDIIAEVGGHRAAYTRFLGHCWHHINRSACNNSGPEGTSALIKSMDRLQNASEISARR